MPKRQSGAILSALELDRASRVPLSRQLFFALHQAIADGSLPAGTRLPATRVLARDLGVSRNCVIHAFEQLADEGCVQSRTGDGTYVCWEFEPLVQREDPRKSASPSLSLSSRGARLANAGVIPRATSIAPLTVGVPDLDLFPRRLWQRLASRRFLDHDRGGLAYPDPAGLPALRDAIARYLSTARGLRCSSSQVLIFSSVQEILTLVALLVTEEGDQAWVEEPGYPPALSAVRAAGARPIPVPVDEHGLVVAQGRQTAPSARLVCTTPSHQFPLGMALTMPRRLELIRWATQEGTWIVEDDYDSEFRLGGRPLCALQGFLPERVIYAGTFSKTLFPALRLAFAVVPDALREPLLAARSLFNPHPPVLVQATAADFIDKGHYATHLRSMTRVYTERKNLIAEQLQGGPAGLRLLPSATGLHVTALLSQHPSDVELTRQARDQGLGVSALSRYYQAPTPPAGILLGYGSTPTETLSSAMQALCEIIEARS